jgi:PAS domain S-box-containing protein
MGLAATADADALPEPGPGAGVAAPVALQQMRRGCLWLAAALCAMRCALLLSGVNKVQPGVLPPLLFGGLALVSAAATRLPPAWLAPALTAVFAGMLLALGAMALDLGWGLIAPGLPLAGLMVCLLCAAAGWRAGVGLAIGAAAVLVTVALQSAPDLMAPVGPGLPTVMAQLVAALVSVAAGLGVGLLVAQVMARYLQSAQEREQRFTRLLALATDAYWELDGQCRLVAASDQGTEDRPRTVATPGRLGLVPWELPQFACDPETLDLLRADLESRRSFRDLPVRWTRSDGRVHAYLASGEPRFDRRGIFNGFWGVARDITEMQAAHEALAATETRYQELFALIPTPLVLHREGQVIDANPSALLLFAHDNLASMLGTDLLATFEAGDSRERARRRTEQLMAAPTGTALPVTGFRMVVQGRQISVRATSVRVEALGGPALLAIFVDDTERLAAEEAVRRSEALLSHLVATSPDLITLTELATGRYAMINHAFERLSGWTPAEAIGHTALELGVWASSAEREDFVQRVREHGSVSDLPVRFVRRDGHVFPLVVSAARFAMDRREYLVINGRDVTERERQRLEREAILANASIGIAVTRQQCFVLANRHFEQIFGWGAGELIGQPCSAAWLDDEDHAEADRLGGPLLSRGTSFELERSMRRKDGSSFVARVRGRAIDPDQADDSGTVWIVEDVTERREFELALARARDQAEAASRAKSAFLANTSHELRTPLNGMIGLARLARDEGTDEARRGQYLDQIVETAQSLAGIISDILDLSKIEAGKLQVESAPFDLGALLLNLQRTYATLASAHNLEFRFEAGTEALGAVLGDALRLRQIVSNYLTNAIKFTPSGWLALQARRLDGERVRIEVRDSGPGVDEALRQELFKPFTQADQSTTRRFGGTGLGLSICRELAALMGGEVGVDSPPGGGSCFWAELPLPAAPAGALGEAPPPRRPEDSRLRGTSVLMVEDNAVNMMIAVAMLERWGVHVAQAQDGREALAAVQQAVQAGRPFDAVLMDVQMPVMSGHEATRALREAGHGLPIIALTAAALVTEREAALQAGMDDFLTKPIDADKLHATLLRWRA